MILLVNGQPRTITADYSLMFVEEPDGTKPVLYFRGKRISKGFHLEILFTMPADETSNANTAD